MLVALYRSVDDAVVDGSAMTSFGFFWFIFPSVLLYSVSITVKSTHARRFACFIEAGETFSVCTFTLWHEGS